MLKETVQSITEDSFSEIQKTIKEINSMIDKAIKEKDKKQLDYWSKELTKILKDMK